MIRPYCISCGTTRLTTAMGMLNPTPADVPALMGDSTQERLQQFSMLEARGTSATSKPCQ